jgi:non-heme chloroperoxidase
MSSTAIKRATLATGITLPYVEQGDPAGVPVVLLHGYSDSWRTYELVLPHLPHALHVFAVTQRGHGDADRPADGYRPEDYAADVAAFMNAVGVEAAVVVGHSGGSYTAQRFALDHPERTLGVVLIGAFHSFADNPSVDELSGAVAALDDPADPGFVREFQESCVAQPIPEGYIAAIVAESLKLPARVWKSYLQGLLEAPVPTEAGTIAAPTLIMWGDRDTFCGRTDQDGLLAAIPGARLETYEGAGHCPHWEEPVRAAADVAGFALRVGGAAPAAIAATP